MNHSTKPQAGIPKMTNPVNSNSTDTIDPLSRVWIHPLDEPLTKEEYHQISDQLNSFTSNWKSHESPTPGYYEIRYQQFIVLVNSHLLSGCSIDSSFKVIKEFNLNRNLSGKLQSNLPKLFFRDSKNNITWKERYQITNLIKNNIITSETIIFNPAVATWKQYQNNWEVEARKSWIDKYFN